MFVYLLWILPQNGKLHSDVSLRQFNVPAKYGTQIQILLSDDARQVALDVSFSHLLTTYGDNNHSCCIHVLGLTQQTEWLQDKLPSCGLEVESPR